MTRRRRVGPLLDGERGAATLEYNGVIAAGAIVVLAVLLAAGTAAPGISDTFRRALCEVTTLGRGDCGASTTPEQHRPTEPCVVSSDSRSMSTEIAVVVVTLGDGRSFEVARLSDGRYRVTQIEGSSVGLEVGVGGGVTVTVNDRTVGGNAVADAGASLDAGNGRVWYTSDPDEVERMINEDGEDAVEDTLFGGGGPFRWVWERGQDGVVAIAGGHDYDFPDPDETFSSAGLSANARAEVTVLTDRGAASAGYSQVMGVRAHRDGRRTYYYETSLEGEAGLQWLEQNSAGDNRLNGTSLSGRLQLVTTATVDEGGDLVEVSTTAVAAGQSHGAINALFGGNASDSVNQTRGGSLVFQATLPIRDSYDEQVARNHLLGVGVGITSPATVPLQVGSTMRFLDAARSRGYLTRQVVSEDRSTAFAVDAEAKLGIELGANVTVNRGSTVTTRAQYWDGLQWIDRTECR